jgi:hypothetical protein
LRSPSSSSHTVAAAIPREPRARRRHARVVALLRRPALRDPARQRVTIAVEDREHPRDIERTDAVHEQIVIPRRIAHPIGVEQRLLRLRRADDARQDLALDVRRIHGEHELVVDDRDRTAERVPRRSSRPHRMPRDRLHLDAPIRRVDLLDQLRDLVAVLQLESHDRREPEPVHHDVRVRLEAELLETLARHLPRERLDRDGSLAIRMRPRAIHRAPPRRERRVDERRDAIDVRLRQRLRVHPHVRRVRGHERQHSRRRLVEPAHASGGLGCLGRLAIVRLVTRSEGESNDESTTHDRRA